MGLIRWLKSTLGNPQAIVPPARLAQPSFAEDTLLAGATRFLRGLTPERMLAIFDNAAQYICDQIQLANELEEYDDHLRGTLALRRAAVLRLKTAITPGDEDDPNSAAAAAAAEELTRAAWWHVAGEHLLRAIFCQHAAVEVLWRESSAAGTLRWQPVGIRPVEAARWNFTADNRPEFFAQLYRAGETLTPFVGRFMLHHVDVTATPGEFAAVRAAALLTYMGKLGLKAWGTTVDQFGVPAIDFTYPEGMSSAELNTIVDEMLTLAQRRLIAHKAGTTVATTDIPNQTPHGDFQDFVRRAVSRLLLGQDSSQTAVDGQRTGATLHGQVREDIRDRDALLLDATQNEWLATWCLWNYGPDVAPPRIQRSAPEPQLDAATLTQAIDILAKVREGKLSPAAARELLEAAGVPCGRAAQMIAATPPLDDQAADLAFKREVVRAFLQDGTVNDVLYNQTDIAALLTAVNVPLQPDYVAPWLPVVAANGGVVTGNPIRDAQGDIVGSELQPGPAPSNGPAFMARLRGLGRGNRTILAADANPLKNYFVGHLNAVRTLLDQLDAGDQADAVKAALFRRRLPELLDQIDPTPLADALHAGTFGAFALGRLKTGALLQRRVATLQGNKVAKGNAKDAAAPTLQPCNVATLQPGAVLIAAAGDGPPPDLSRAQFKTAIDQFAQRHDLVSKPKFLQLEGLDRARAWTVARVADLNVLKDLHDAVGNVIEGGQSWRDFRESLDVIMEKRGWGGLDPWHARLVYDQNLAMAYSAGRTTQARDAGLTHWRKLESVANEPRPEHAAFNGQIFAFTQKSPPPWDFGCQCEWKPVFADELNANEMATLGGPSDQLPGADEFRWDASHYFRAPELRKGDYPQDFWGVIDGVGALFNKLLTP